jgi:antibiotic biosynthesis monooxygenase (ABM) superfamily enzyme
MRVDAAFMTGNVAQVFLTDEEWMATLRAARAALRSGGRLVFETHIPAREVWRSWAKETTLVRANVPGVGLVTSSNEVTEVRGELVTFQTTFRFHQDEEVLRSESTIRFRERPDIEASLQSAGFTVDDVRDAPDRPGLEYVFIAVSA